MTMTMDRFTIRGRRILDIAKEEAKRRNHAEIDTGHLLLGLILETKGVAAKVLIELGVDLAAIGARIESAWGNGDDDSREAPTVSTHVERVLELAAYLADQLGHIYIGTEHLIIALLEDGSGSAADTLRSYVTPSEVIDQIIKHIVQSVRSSPVDRQLSRESMARVRQTLTNLDQEPNWSLSQTITDVLKYRRQRMVEQLSQAAAQEERNRLARDLHDSIKQQLFSISTSAAAAQAHWQSDPEGAHQALEDVQQNARAAMVEMDAMLQQLSPTPLAAVGLVEALRQQCEALEYRTGATVTTSFGPLPPPDLISPRIYDALFRMAQEAFSNIARHARASNIHVGVEWSEEMQTLLLHVQDDGSGFDLDSSERGMGLENIRTRSEEFGGRLAINSVGGEGTTLRVEIPTNQM